MIKEQSTLVMDKKDIIRRFQRGEIGIFPTDTAYGIGARIDDVLALKRIFKIRKRPKEKALLALVASVEMAKKYVKITKEDEKKLEKFWPGGLTVIFECYKDKVPAIVRAGGKTLAIRLPDKEDLRDIISGVGVPIVAPSANFSGASTPFDITEVDPSLISKVDFVVSGVCTMKGVSTIVDATSVPWKIIRQGVVNIDS